MKEWKKGRVRLVLSRGGLGDITEVLPTLHVSVYSWSEPAGRAASLTISMAWLRWFYAVSVEVRHG